MDLVPHQPSESSSDADLALGAPTVTRRAGWLFWWIAPILLLLPMGVGFFALSNLLQLPAIPKCFNARQAPPTDQIYCAKQLASKHDTESLRRAILLANAVESNHPLRQESDRLIELWAGEILRRAEAEFQKGDLQGAIEIAQEVPARVRAYRQVREAIQAWEDLWAEAERFYQQGQDAIAQEDWYGALEAGRRLIQLNNRYWTTERYRDLMRQLQTARDNQKKNPNKNKVARGPVPNSPDMVEDFLSEWEREQEQEDRNRLQQARQQAQSGDVENLRMAIAQAQEVLYGTSSYDEAQEAIAQWRQQMETLEDRPYLERAQQLANQGEWQAAINEASNIGWGRALYEEARDRIEGWRDQAYQQQQQQRNAELERITGQPAPSPFPPAPVTPPAMPAPPLPGPSTRAPVAPSTVPISDTPGN